jgi:hypothetical protein
VDDDASLDAGDSLLPYMARVQLTGAIALQECSHQPAALRVIAGVAKL